MPSRVVLSACGSGIATSSHIRQVIDEALKERGVKDCVVRTCGVAEIAGLIDSMDPAVIVHTMSLETVKNPKLADVKCMSGMPILTGVRRKEMLDELAEYIKTI